jgi:hypothetical protein
VDRRVSVENSKPAAKPQSSTHRHYFFKNPTFEVIFLTALGRAYGSAKRRQKSGVRRLPRQGPRPASKATLNFRVRPYGFASYYDTFKAAQSYNLESVAAQIRCPILITDPANEQYGPVIATPLQPRHLNQKTGPLL